MENTDGQMNVMRFNEPGGELLDAKYYCKVYKREKLDVVIKLKTNKNLIRNSSVADRYVIVMDVSASMDETVVGDSRTLLERMKVFGNLFIDNLSMNSWVSLVTFSNFGSIVLPMTKMDKFGKKKAKEAVEGLQSWEMTNISDGLFSALEAIESSSKDPSRDCIILFTDGQANTGITDAKQLVSEFKLQVEKSGRAHSVPVSAFTIGDNQPYFISQVALGLGSDSFYWLDEHKDFEADMLLPVLLRELPSITDITLEITCQNDVKFLDEHESQPSLQTKIGDETQIHRIHMLPAEMEKNIFLTLQILEETQQEDIDGKIILEVWKRFFDNNLQEHSSTDYIELKLTSMKDVFYDAYNFTSTDVDALDFGPDAMKYLEDTSSYIKERNATNVSWDDAQESMVNVLGQQCRLQTATALGASASLVDRGRESEAKATCQKALSNLEEIEKITQDVLGENNPHCKTLQDTVKGNYQGQLETLTEDISNFKPGRLTAMASSFSTEMPTSSAVFGEEVRQPFMTTVIEKKFENVKENLRNLITGLDDVETKETQTPEIKSVEKKVVYVFKLKPNTEEEFDPDSLFLTSILPDLQQLESKKKLELKLDILNLIHKALYS